MKALVIYETSYGNTGQVAQAIAAGLAGQMAVDLHNVADAEPTVPDDVDLLVLGGPTHAFSMSRASTRADASRRQGHPATASRGIRDWLGGLAEGGHPQTFAAFDTRMDMPLLTGAASRAATRAAKHLGFAVTKPHSFIVESYTGPLQAGEVERAREWGVELAGRAAGGAR